MNRFKEKQLTKLVAHLKEVAATVNLSTSHRLTVLSLTQDLMQLMLGAANKPHKGPGRVRYMTASLNSALKKVQEAMGSRPIALIGGLAVIHWVQIRETQDLDFAVLSVDMPLVRQKFPGGLDNPLMYTVQVDGENVDFMLDDIFPWAEQAISTAVNSTVLGTTVRVAKPEYLILYKLKAARDRDMGDIKALLTLEGIADKARSLVQKHLPEDLEDFEAMVLASEYGV